jgi:predicted DCC family thiol-disulfide oxidoreductase YuxK
MNQKDFNNQTNVKQMDTHFSDTTHAIVLFDGVCNLCNASVQFIIDRDPQAYFKFASLQSEVGQGFCHQFGINEGELDTVMLIENGKLYTHSAAPLRVSRHLKGAWPLMYAFVIVPPFLRNMVYRWIARNRYKWFGKQEACRIPTPELKARFLG